MLLYDITLAASHKNVKRFSTTYLWLLCTRVLHASLRHILWLHCTRVFMLLCDRIVVTCLYLAQLACETVPLLTTSDDLCLQVNTRPDSDCTASSSSSQVNEPLSRSGSAQSLEYIHRVSPGGSSTELDSPSYRMPATPKPLDRTNSNRSMGSDSNKSVGIAAVHAAPGTSHSGMPAQDTLSAQTSVLIGPGAVPASDKSSRGFMNKWMAGLLKGGNANKKKEARISQLLRAAAASGGAVGGGQYCTADAASHEYCAKAVLRSTPLKTGIYQQ